MKDIIKEVVEYHLSPIHLLSIFANIKNRQGITLTKCCDADYVSSYDSYDGWTYHCKKCGDIVYYGQKDEKTYKPMLKKTDLSRVIEETFNIFVKDYLLSIIIEKNYPTIDFKLLKQEIKAKVTKYFMRYIKGEKCLKK